MLQELAASYEDSKAVIDYYKTNTEAMQSVNAAVMEEMIVEWVLERANVVDKETDFYALIKPEAQTEDKDKNNDNK